MPLLQPNFISEQQSSGAQVIDGSVRFNTTGYLERTQTAGDQTTWTWSSWIKVSDLSGNNIFGMEGGYPNIAAFFQTDGKLRFSGSAADESMTLNLITTPEYRDLNGWYHVVLNFDTRNSTQTERARIYINGERVTDLGTTTYPSLNDTTEVNNNGNEFRIASHSGVDHLDGYTTTMYFLDGQALGPEYFGFTDPLTNTWRPKKLETTGPNDGTTWSSVSTISSGSAASGKPLSNGFDGSISTAFEGDTSGATVTVPVSATVGLGGVRVYAAVTSGNPLVVLLKNGDTTVETINGGVSGAQWYSNSSYSGPITSLVISRTGRAPEFNAIKINNVILKDNTTTNLEFGVNGFHLPMDGSAPVGQDQSGKANDYVAYNFGSSIALDKATGALPILNTVSGGNYPTVGTRTDENASNLVLAMPLVGIATDLSSQIKGSGSSKSITVSGATASIAESNLYGGSFVFDGTNDQITVGDVATDLDFGTGDYTVEAWFRLTGTGDEYVLNFNTDHGGASAHWGINIYSTNLIRAGRTDGSGDASHSVSHTFITNKWYHVAVSRSSGTSRLFLDGNLLDEEANTDDIDPTGDLLLGRHSAGGSIFYNGYIQDVRIYKGVGKYTKAFNPPSTNPDIFPDTPSGVSGSSKLTKIIDGAVAFEGSATSKLTLADSTDFTFGTNDFCIEFFYYNKRLPDNTSYDIIFDCMGSNRSGIQLAIETDGDYRIEVGDGASNWIWQSTGFDSKSIKWTHFALTREGSTFRAFEDGVLLGTQTSSTAVGDPRSPAIGGYASDDSTNYGFNGYISNFRIVNGSAVYTAAFTPPTAPLTDVTNTKLLCCQSNTSATEGAVKPGTITANGDAAATNFNPFNTDINTVLGQETRYSTWNPLDQGSGVTLSEGNLRASINGTTNSGVRGTMTLPTSGKYFFAIEMNVIDNAADAFAGLMYMRQKNTVRDLTAAGARLVVRGSGSILNDSTGITGRYFVGEGYDELGVAVDCDANTVQFYVNGAPSASAQTPSVSITDDWAPYCGCSSGTSVFTLNAGQKPFKFPPPDGFQPLNLTNTRPETVIARPDQYVGAAVYTSGNGSAVTVNSYNFAPELLWFKDLDDSNNWSQFDTVRGYGKRLDSTGAGKEQDWSAYFGSFEPNGFTVTNQTSDINRSTNSICSWGWKAGGNPGITTTAFWVDDIEYASAAAAGLNGGTITPVSASVGTRQGFSMLTYRSNLTTGATLSHGLTQKPDFAIFKNCDSTLGVNEVDWGVYHTVVGATKRLELNQNLAEQAFPGPFNDTEPTSSLFTFGGGSQGHSYLTNGPAGEKFVAWIWHNVPGLQKFGSYEGNGSSDGPFVELGFRPAVLILKCIDNYGDDYDWRLIDSTREPFNDGSGSKYVLPNKSDNQADNSPIDFLSNGFKIRSSTNEINLNAHTFVYAAWAAAPSFNLYGAQSNAR